MIGDFLLFKNFMWLKVCVNWVKRNVEILFISFEWGSWVIKKFVCYSWSWMFIGRWKEWIMSDFIL